MRPLHTAFDVKDLHFDVFASGFTNTSPDIIGEGTADASADLNVQGIGADHLSVGASLDGIINLKAFDELGGTAAVDLSATADAKVTTNNYGISQGSAHETIGIEVSAYLPSDHAVLDLRVIDTLALDLKATGFLASASSNVSATDSGFAQVASRTSGGHACAPFNLAAFAATVLNRDDWHIQFTAGSPSESALVTGYSVLSVAASVQYLVGGLGSKVTHTETYQQTDRSMIVFAAHG